jgi:hypothetical protein
VISFFAWQALTPAPVAPESGEQVKIAELETKLELLAKDQGKSMREDAYREVLTAVVASQTGDPNLVEQFTNLKTEHARMQANLEGQLALANKLKFERNSAAAQLDAKTRSAEKLESRLAATRSLYDDANKKYKTLESKVTDGELILEEPATGTLTMPWWWLVIGSFVVGLLGCALGYALSRREDHYDRFEPAPKNNPSSENPGVRDSAFEPQDDPPASGAAQPAEGNIPLTIDGNNEN